MENYFQTYYIAQDFGPGYVVTNVFYVMAVVLLLNDMKWNCRSVMHKLLEMALCWLGSVVFCSMCYALLGHNMMTDRVMMALLIAAYALFCSKYKAITRVVRSFVFYSCMMQIIPISEPIGELIEDVNASYTWAEHLTSLVVVVMGGLVLWFLHKFSTERLTFVPVFPGIMVATTAALGVMLQVVNSFMAGARAFNILVAGSFWILELLGYYLFYMVSQEYDRNLELLAMHHKEELDEELLHFSRKNYEEMHQIRHEIKNHLAYIKALADNGEYQKMREYLATVSGETEALFRFVECGNDVVNAVINHAIKQADSCGVGIAPQIIVPPEMPYRETELCSLLSNLMDNAIEAASESGQEAPVVAVSIRPQQDYLLIRVTNPVNDSVSARRRLTLRTTKEQPWAHGYGTKIIRNVAQRNQGSVKFDIKDGQFIADVMLYLEEETHGEAVSGNL